jgi:8-oxo-dGTP pyrophosphatase MutT (NUDIX family)
MTIDFNGEQIKKYKKTFNGSISPRTLVFPFDKNGQLILGLKKRGFGEGFYNGFGGKLEAGETYFGCAKRELMEELGVTSTSLILIGKINFYFPQTEKFPENKRAQTVFVFKCEDFTGCVAETEEMNPKTFPIDKLPVDKMWPDAIYYISLINTSNWFLEVLYDEKLEIADVKLTKEFDLF